MEKDRWDDAIDRFNERLLTLVDFVEWYPETTWAKFLAIVMWGGLGLGTFGFLFDIEDLQPAILPWVVVWLFRVGVMFLLWPITIGPTVLSEYLRGKGIPKTHSRIISILSFLGIVLLLGLYAIARRYIPA